MTTLELIRELVKAPGGLFDETQLAAVAFLVSYSGQASFPGQPEWTSFDVLRSRRDGVLRWGLLLAEPRGWPGRRCSARARRHFRFGLRSASKRAVSRWVVERRGAHRFAARSS
jgi:hypothetical protein